MAKYINHNMYLCECKNTILNNGGHGQPLPARARTQSQTNPHVTGGRKKWHWVKFYSPIFRVSLVSIIPPTLHTDSFIYYRRCIISVSVHVVQ